MNSKYVIEDINNFLDYKKKSLAEFHAAIGNIDLAKTECIKNFDLLGAWKLLRLQTRFEILLSKKTCEMDKEEIRHFKKKS